MAAPIFESLPAGSVATIASGSELYDLPNGAVLRKTSAEVVRSVLVTTKSDRWYGLVTVQDQRVVFTPATNVSNVHVVAAGPGEPSTPVCPPPTVAEAVQVLLAELVKQMVPIVEAEVS